MVRLHYRPLNALAKFKTIEKSRADATFTIPAADIDSDYDLLYYFEILNSEYGGWFQPDPMAATPYYVIEARK